MLLSGPAAWKKIIYSKLNNELGTIISLEIGSVDKVEFIITNYNITNVSTPVIQVSDKMTRKDVDSIKKFLRVTG